MKLIKKNYKFNFFEPLIITAFWALLFASPLLFGRFEDQIDWSHIFHVWLNYLPLVALFSINRFVLLPKLFFRGKKLTYFISTTVLIGTITLGSIFFNSSNNLQQRELPPLEINANGGFHKPPPPEFSKNGRPSMQPRGNRPAPIPAYANFLILAVLLVGFDAGLQISMRWANLEQEKMKLQNENVENQLAFLKNQVSPHFFMNTLNNIHALVDIDIDEAKNAIIKLSHLMRHLLYDSEGKMTPIKKEIDFINSYIELMKLRFSDKVKINVDISSEIPNKTIPPLLFTSLLENAFKHGISYNKESFITINLSFDEHFLNFKIENSNHKKIAETASGIGVENTRKRLDLIYKNNYNMDINESEKIYSVNLKVPI